MSNTLKFVKRGVSVAVTTTTIAWSVGLAALVPLATKAAATPGSLVKVAGDSAVYYLGTDSKLYGFPNAKTYFSWYQDFSGVQTISASEIATYPPAGKNVTMRPGTKLIKLTTDPKVYAVEPGGVIRQIGSEAVAKTLFGDTWASRVVDVPLVFWGYYSVPTTNAVISTNSYPTGTLVKSASSSDIYYVDGSQKRLVDAGGLAGNKFNTTNVVTAPDAVFNALLAGPTISGQDSNIWNLQNAAGTQPPVGGSGLTVAVAADTPNLQAHSAGTAYNNALKLTLTASADGAVNVTGLTVTRLGLSADANISGVAVFDSTGRRHGNFVSFADTKALLDFPNDIITVPAGQSTTVWVKTNIAAGVVTGTYQLSIAKKEDVKTTASVSGNFPASGGGFSMIGAAVGAVTVQDMILAAAVQNVDIGVTDYELQRFRFTGGANEDVKITELNLFLNGTVDDNDLMNFELVNLSSGQVLQTVQASNRYVRFSGFEALIPEGAQRDLSVRVDTVDGSTRTAQLVIQNDYDVTAWGVETGSGLLPTATAGGNDTTFPIGDTANRNTIQLSAGTLTVAKASTSPSGDVGIGVQNAVLAEWDIEVKGEDIELQRADLNLAGTGIVETDFTGTIKLQTKSGKILLNLSVPGTGDIDELFDGDAAGSDSQTFSSFHIVKAGTKETLQLLANTNSGTTPITAGDAPVAGISDIFGKRLLSNNFATFSAGTRVNGNTLNVTAVTLTVTPNGTFPAATLTAGQTSTRVGSFILQTNNADGANVSAIAIQLINAGAVDAADLSNLLLKRTDTNGQIGTTIATPQVGAGNNNTFSVSGQLNLGANKTVQVDVFADVNTGASDGGANDTLNARIAAAGVTATGSTSGTTINNVPAAAVNSATLIFETTGTLTVSIDTSGAASSSFYTVGLSGVEMARLRLTTTVEGAKVQELRLRTVRGTGNIANVKLLGTGLSPDPVAPLTSGEAVFTFSTGSELQVPKDGSKVLTAVVDTAALQSLLPRSLGVLGFGTMNAIGSGSGQRVQERTTGTVFTASADDGSEAAVVGSVVYFTETTATGAVVPGFYAVTANGGAGDQGLTDDGLSLGVAGVSTPAKWTAGNIVTFLTATSNELSADADSDNALNVGDLVFFFGDVAGADNSASSGWHVVTTATGADASPINLDGAAVAVDAGDTITRFAAGILPNGIIGNVMRFEEVEPIITKATDSPSGSAAPDGDQIVAKFTVKAEGGRQLNWTSLTIEKVGSNSPERYVTDFTLENSTGTDIARVANTTVTGTVNDGAGGTFTLNGTTFDVCTGAVAADNDLGGISNAEWNTLQIGDTIAIVDDTDASTTSHTITNRVGDTAVDGTCDGSDQIVVNTAPTGIATDATLTIRNNRVHFDANQSNTNDIALATQTLTEGTSATYTVKANTTAVKTGVTSGTVTFGVNVPGSNGPLQIAATQVEGLAWNYTALNTANGGAPAIVTEGDSYPVNGGTLSY